MKSTVFLLQLADTLLFSSEWIADATLSTLLGFILRHPTTDRSQADSHALADMLNTQSLFLDHAHNFQFEIGVVFLSLLCHLVLP